ncbi:MAG: hypothetical protein HY305_05420, partial [Sphingobacteriales bacterium]|nr:hypothetical protein [Sphingobacteriales bacterium]
ELVDAFVNEKISYNDSCCQFDKERAENAVHEIFLALDMVLEMLKTMNPSILFEMQKYHPDAFQKFYKHKNEFMYSVIRDNIMKGTQEELYRPDIKVDILARFRVESLMLPFHPDFHGKIKFDLAVIQEELIYHFLFGLVSQKGYKLILKYQQDRLKKIPN